MSYQNELISNVWVLCGDYFLFDLKKWKKLDLGRHNHQEMKMSGWSKPGETLRVSEANSTLLVIP